MVGQRRTGTGTNGRFHLFPYRRKLVGERQMMRRSFSWDLPVARIAALILVSLPIAVLAAPTHDSGVSNLSTASQLSTASPTTAPEPAEGPSDDTIRVPIWIPGFDDVEPAFTCSAVPSPFLTHFSGKPRFAKVSAGDSCSGSRRLLPWNSAPAPEVRIRFSPLVV